MCSPPAFSSFGNFSRTKFRVRATNWRQSLLPDWLERAQRPPSQVRLWGFAGATALCSARRCLQLADLYEFKAVPIASGLVSAPWALSCVVSDSLAFQIFGGPRAKSETMSPAGAGFVSQVVWRGAVATSHRRHATRSASPRLIARSCRMPSNLRCAVERHFLLGVAIRRSCSSGKQVLFLRP